MNAAHTPGPWVWDDNDKPRRLAGPGPDADVFDYAEYEGMWFAAYHQPTDVANARLIAAAPDLLEALEALLQDVHTDMHFDLARAARAAIAKARGNA